MIIDYGQASKFYVFKQPLFILSYRFLIVKALPSFQQGKISQSPIDTSNKYNPVVHLGTVAGTPLVSHNPSVHCMYRLWVNILLKIIILHYIFVKFFLKMSKIYFPTPIAERKNIHLFTPAVDLDPGHFGQ